MILEETHTVEIIQSVNKINRTKIVIRISPIK